MSKVNSQSAGHIAANGELLTGHVQAKAYRPRDAADFELNRAWEILGRLATQFPNSALGHPAD